MKYKRGSFITIPNKELLDGQSPTLQTLYMWLCDYANSTGECFPSRETLAKKCGVTKITITRTMKKLVDLKLVIVECRFEEKRQTTNLYSLPIDALNVGGRVSQRYGGGYHNDTQNSNQYNSKRKIYLNKKKQGEKMKELGVLVRGLSKSKKA